MCGRSSKRSWSWLIEIQWIRIAEILTTITTNVVLLTNSGGIVAERIRGIGNAVAVSDYDRESRIYRRGAYDRIPIARFKFRFPIFFLPFPRLFSCSFCAPPLPFFPFLSCLIISFGAVNLYANVVQACRLHAARCHAKCSTRGETRLQTCST